jgi:hypothetical protein
MAEETVCNPPPVNLPADGDDARSDSEAESIAMTTSSSPTCGAAKMAEGEIPELPDFFKKTVIIEEECQAYHDHGWLAGNLISTIPEVDVPTVHDLTVIFFESHLATELGLPPSKFLVSIMNYLGGTLVHFNPNTIAALSLLWYYYSRHGTTR